MNGFYREPRCQGRHRANPTPTLPPAGVRQVRSLSSMFSSRFIEADPYVMMAYERVRADARYSIFDSWPIVKEMNTYLISYGREPSVNPWDFQEMVLRFSDNRDHYLLCLRNAQKVMRRAAGAAGTGAGTGAATGAGKGAATAAAEGTAVMA